MMRRKIMKLAALMLILSMVSLTFTGCNDSQSTANNASESEYTHRVILMTDPHYSYEETYDELKVMAPESKPSRVTGKAFGYTQLEKMQSIIKDIDDFNAKEPIEAVFVLGDITTDDYGYRNLPDNYLEKFKKDFIDQLSYPCYTIAGNHDSYPNKDWKKAIGTDRQFSVKVGDAAFIMLDTFSDDPATATTSGSPYIGIDVEFLKEEIAKYPTEKIFLCSHYYTPNDETPDYELTKLMKENDRIVCLFRGHTHLNSVLMSSELDDRFVFDAGGYAYYDDSTDGAWDFSYFDDSWAWGYQVLEWNDTEVHTYHVKPPRLYTASNGTFDFVGCIEDEYTISLLNEEEK